MKNTTSVECPECDLENEYTAVPCSDEYDSWWEPVDFDQRCVACGCLLFCDDVPSSKSEQRAERLMMGIQ